MKNFSVVAIYLLISIIGMWCEGCSNKSTLINRTPKWAQEVVWYQIFVERFYNGDPTNDPTPKDIKEAYPRFVPNGWHITPWTQDWYKEDDYFASLQDANDYSGNSITTFGQKSQLRRYGGDLQGVLDKIDYLDSLGVTAIYFNPLNDAPSLHKYDPRHWRHIDRNFGPNPSMDAKTIATEIPNSPSTWKFTQADKLFLKVIDLLHQRGIKVILDYSWNHTGQSFWALKDIINKQKNSKFVDWYWINSFDNPDTKENEFSYKGWFGISDLPEIKETVLHDESKPMKAYEGDIYSEDVKRHIFSVSKRWIDPNDDGDTSDGVDGFRLDVAAELPLGFWRDYRKFIKSINPEAYLVGEIWWEAWPDKLLNPKPFLNGDVFDAVMNYRWYRLARNYFNASPDSINATHFVDGLQKLQKGIQKSNNYAMMNLCASHDSPRLLTSLFNKNAYKYHCNPEIDSLYKVHKPDLDTYRTLKLFLAHQYTYIGSPHIWAGDEMGMWGADDPSNRKPLIWPEYSFEMEKEHPIKGVKRPPNEVMFDTVLFSYYQRLIRIRKEYQVLSSGDIEFIHVDDNTDIIAYRRYNHDEDCIVVFNNNNRKHNVTLDINKLEAPYQDILNKITVHNNVAEKQLQLELAAKTAAILVNN